MDGPGASLFQGGGSIQINTSLQQRQQEEEDLEEQKLRNEKLQNELQNAFDDLSDDDDDTVATENNHSIDNPVNRFDEMINMYNRQHPQSDQYQQQQHVELVAEINRLNAAVDMKTREVINVTKMLQEIKQNYEIPTNELKKRLTLAEAEKERAYMTKQQTHELLVESKTKISDQEDMILQLKCKIKTLETTKENLTTELEHTKTLLSDTQHKYALVERTAGYTANKQADAVLKQAHERHTGQIDMMQQQIDGLRIQLEEKDSELKLIDVRYKELQRSREQLLLEKSDTINQLSKTIEDSQRQCQMLMAKGDATQENNRLRQMVMCLQRQTEDMQKTINNLTNRLEINNTATPANLDYGISLPEQFSKINQNHSTPIQHSQDRLSQLKNELNRCMAGQKEKRDEIKKLEEQLITKNAEIKRLKDDENSALVQMMAYRDESERLTMKLKNIQIELDRVTAIIATTTPTTATKTANNTITENIIGQHQQNNDGDIKRLQNKIDSLTQDLRNYETNYKCLEEKYAEIKCEKMALNTELQAFKQHENNVSIDKQHWKNEFEKQTIQLAHVEKECAQLTAHTVQLNLWNGQLTKELEERQEINTQNQKSFENDLQMKQLKCNEFQDMLNAERIQHENEIKQWHDKYEKDFNIIPKHCSKCTDLITHVAKLEVENLNLENKCSNYVKDIQALRQSLSDFQAMVRELKQKVNLKKEHDQLLAELKEKAAKFEIYIQTQSPLNQKPEKSSDEHILKSPISLSSSPASPSPSPSLSMSSSLSQIKDKNNQNAVTTLLATNEMKIREQSAKILATQIKSIEDDFKAKLYENQREIQQLHDHCAELTYQLKIRTTEVHVLKQAILGERTKMAKILQQKNSDATVLVDKKMADALKLCEDKLQHMEQQLNVRECENIDRYDQLTAEIKSLEALVQQREKEKSVLQKNETELYRTLADFKLKHEKIVNEMTAKYKSAKKTATNYKKYAEDKDKHIAEENQRIKLAYQAAITKLQEKAAAAVRENLININL